MVSEPQVDGVLTLSGATRSLRAEVSKELPVTERTLTVPKLPEQVLPAPNSSVRLSEPSKKVPVAFTCLSKTFAGIGIVHHPAAGETPVVKQSSSSHAGSEASVYLLASVKVIAFAPVLLNRKRR